MPRMNALEKLSRDELRRLHAIDEGALWHPFTQMRGHREEDPPPPVIVGADGNWLIDAEGKRYLDANSGYWCLALGCRPKEVEAAIAAQLQRFGHSTLLGISHRPALELASKITELAGAPLNHAFFADSGSEAVEVALKMAYQYQVLRGHPERRKFLAFGEAYHGDTIGCVSLGGIGLFHATFKPLLFDVVRVPPPQGCKSPWEEASAEFVEAQARPVLEALEKHAHELAALVMEPLVVGPGGVIPQPPAYVKRIVESARARSVPVVFDEVAVGMGRLGWLFAFEIAGVKPDILCLAKGLTGGLLPLSATLASDEIYEAFLGTFAERRTFYHGHTFTGSALGCAAALAALDVFTRDGGAFLKRAREETIPAFWRALQPLREHRRVGDVRGMGMMAGIAIVKDKAGGEAYPYERRAGYQAVLALRKRGVQTRAIGDLLLAVPPLTVTPDEIALLGRAYAEALDEIE